MQIGPYVLTGNVIAAPMAGVTDLPFRRLCRRWGAALAVSEMISADPGLRGTRKTRRRMDHRLEPGPVSVQIAGADPGQMARAAQYNADRGAQIIDINMGCPAKKVCNKLAGSALLGDEDLVRRILHRVVRSVDIPVTLKIRTGPTPQNRNAERIAAIAEDAGVCAIAVHGRTRACRFKGRAEYRTIRAVKRAVDIPVLANGDIDSPETARRVLRFTGADGVMIGRAAQGKPWLFQQIDDLLRFGRVRGEPDVDQQRDVFLAHLTGLYDFYGERSGVLIARKHISWYLKERVHGRDCWRRVRCVEEASRQYRILASYFDEQLNQTAIAA